ncbi:hypothetical protein H5410_046119, partial [Solanum commersonii]
NLMDIIKVTRFHHGGKFVEGTSGGGLAYIEESEVKFGPTGYLCGPTVGESVNEDGVENSHNINMDEGLQQGAAQSENINVEFGVDEGLQQGATQSENINVEVVVDDASYLKGVETNWDISDDSQEFSIPDDNDSEINEELRTLRNERRTKLQRKKHVPKEKITLGVAGVDRGFEDIGRNKAAGYAGRLRGDKQSIDCSELDNDDSWGELDHEVVEGVDLPARRKSKKIMSKGCVLDTSGPIDRRPGDEKKEENNSGDILAARHKSIITMLEEIRHKIMDRNVEMRKFVDTWISDISPMASLVLEENKNSTRDCQVRFNGQFGYEILDGHYRHNIDIRTKTCTCRTWQLRGIPCQHVVLAYQHAGQDPKDHVVHWYRKDTFMKAYNYFISPIPNMKMWSHTSDIVIEPPEPKQMPGRPPKYRRKSKDEPRKKYGKLSMRGVKMTCSNCHQQGHNNKAFKYVVILKPTFDYFN